MSDVEKSEPREDEESSHEMTGAMSDPKNMRYDPEKGLTAPDDDPHGTMRFEVQDGEVVHIKTKGIKPDTPQSPPQTPQKEQEALEGVPNDTQLNPNESDQD